MSCDGRNKIKLKKTAAKRSEGSRIIAARIQTKCQSQGLLNHVEAALYNSSSARRYSHQGLAAAGRPSLHWKLQSTDHDHITTAYYIKELNRI